MNAVDLIIVSDSTGETAEHVAHAAMSQFDAAFANVSRFRYIDSDEKLSDVFEKVAGKKVLIVGTLVAKELRRKMAKEAEVRGIPCIDLMGQLLDTLEERAGYAPSETPGLLRRLDEEYFRRIKAVEFAIKCDDGKSPESIPLADLVVLGVSRAGKTPLSMYIANKGYKVANIPLIPEVDLPEIVRTIPAGRLVGLIIRDDALIRIRQERLRMIGLNPEASTYASTERVLRELDHAKRVLKELHCRVYDVTGKAVEETAQEILDVLRG
jgi:regulator of PEP synthase PpsR (kinase-PPPase family)